MQINHCYLQSKTLCVSLEVVNATRLYNRTCMAGIHMSKETENLEGMRQLGFVVPLRSARVPILKENEPCDS